MTEIMIVHALVCPYPPRTWSVKSAVHRLTKMEKEMKRNQMLLHS